MDRRFETAADVVQQLDQMALAEKREITRALAVRIINEKTDQMNASD